MALSDRTHDFPQGPRGPDPTGALDLFVQSPPMTDWLPITFYVVVALALMTTITAWVVLRDR